MTASRSAQRHLEAALCARARHHCLVPALDVGVIVQADLMTLVPPGPAEDREIGDRDIVAGGVPRLAEALVEDAVEPVRLLHVAVKAVAAVLFHIDLQAKVHLARDETED